ncbi:carbamoyltransferase HypF [Sporosarcina sp. UB5]|uniref:carbamoyltransferase HypF n=1 Tax=Sporosarcina sp. UB5 TaxID=3047463 RepID=UPI003D78D686
MDSLDKGTTPLILADRATSELTFTLYRQGGKVVAENEVAIIRATDLIKQGKIIAIKGIGGFHLACNAYVESVVDELRRRKNRPQKPLALMVKSIEVAKKLCYMSEHEEELLTSPASPIVLLQRKKEAPLPRTISPGLSTVGIMLPYTPLHHLLFSTNEVQCLVMTSANPSRFPIFYKEDQLEQLETISDYVLTHNRTINFPIDDSVVRHDGENIVFVRRARGFAPNQFDTTVNVNDIIALGGNQKNTLTGGKHNRITIGPQIGDLENEEMIAFFEDRLRQFEESLGVNEPYVAVDKHPLYASGLIAKKLKRKSIVVQHHHAHHVSCMEDNNLQEPCLGIILDGTGYGEDGNIWGFEFLYGNATSFERLAHLRYTPLPGGEKAVEEPWRNAVGMLLSYWPEEGKDLCRKLFPDKVQEINIIEKMVAYKLNTPLAGTCGRLFDAVSAILGICSIATYEGEAAEKLSDYMYKVGFERAETVYAYDVNMNRDERIELDFSPMIAEIIQDKFHQQPLTKIIQKFHTTIVASCVETILTLVKNRPSLRKTVVLSGGSFQNMFLCKEIKKDLQREGFNVYTHKHVPCHDGGLSLGQLIIAAHALSNR